MQEMLLSEHSETSREIKRHYISLALVLVLLLIPIWLVNYPGMIDYPNHLVRCYILAHYHENPIWQQVFYLDYSPLPNLALDFIIAPLSRVLPLLVCGKIFSSLTAILYVVGCSEVARAISGKPNRLSLLVAFTFYNSQLLWGFLNFMFGVGVFLCVFAYWLRIRNSMTWWRSFLCCLLSLVSYFAHLSSVSFLGIACLTVTALDYYQDRKISKIPAKLLWLVCPVLLMKLFVASVTNIGGIDWGSLRSRFLLFLSPVRTYSIPVDLSVAAILLICIYLFLRHCSISPIAITGIVFAVFVLATPFVMYTMAYINSRYVMPSYLMFLLAIQPAWTSKQKAAFWVALFALTARTGFIAGKWIEINHYNEQIIAMGQVLPPGARVFVLQDFSTNVDRQKTERGFAHATELWWLTRNAEESSLFANIGQQALVFRKTQCMSLRCASTADYQYIWSYDPGVADEILLNKLAVPVSTWKDATLWRVKNPRQVSSAPFDLP